MKEEINFVEAELINLGVIAQKFNRDKAKREFSFAIRNLSNLKEKNKKKEPADKDFKAMKILIERAEKLTAAGIRELPQNYSHLEEMKTNVFWHMAKIRAKIKEKKEKEKARKIMLGITER